MNLGHIILSLRNQIHKTIYCMVPFIRNVQNREIQRQTVVLWLPGAKRVGKEGMVHVWQWNFFWGWWKHSWIRMWCYFTTLSTYYKPLHYIFYKGEFYGMWVTSWFKKFLNMTYINQICQLTKILLRSFSDKNFTGGYFWVKLYNTKRLKEKVKHLAWAFSLPTVKTNARFYNCYCSFSLYSKWVLQEPSNHW